MVLHTLSAVCEFSFKINYSRDSARRDGEVSQATQSCDFAPLFFRTVVAKKIDGFFLRRCGSKECYFSGMHDLIYGTTQRIAGRR